MPLNQAYAFMMQLPNEAAQGAFFQEVVTILPGFEAYVKEQKFQGNYSAYANWVAMYSGPGGTLACSHFSILNGGYSWCEYNGPRRGSGQLSGWMCPAYRDCQSRPTPGQRGYRVAAR